MLDSIENYRKLPRPRAAHSQIAHLSYIFHIKLGCNHSLSTPASAAIKVSAGKLGNFLCKSGNIFDFHLARNKDNNSNNNNSGS